jgi:nicotinate-nucleotide pyrophosphorylase (carboxylating)
VADARESAADARRIAVLALAEDGPRDVTTDITVTSAQQAAAAIEARSALVLAGCEYADAIVAECRLPPIEWNAQPGELVGAGRDAGSIRGPLAAILRAERPLLNMLQRSCGIATLTRGYVDAVASTDCAVLHTRKTTPGLRTLELAAVCAGGGGLHRADLAHAVLIKDNHWQALRQGERSLADALAAAADLSVTELCVEVESLAQLQEACAAGATRLLIDNQAPAIVREWSERARMIRPGIRIEASGGITLANVRDYAAAGADFVSVGALTHSVPSADLALEIRTITS